MYRHVQWLTSFGWQYHSFCVADVPLPPPLAAPALLPAFWPLLPTELGPESSSPLHPAKLQSSTSNPQIPYVYIRSH
jgi:hypothetical protein